MNIIDSKNAVFVIVDVQEKLVKMLTDDNVKKNSVILAKTSNILNIPIIITEQYPKGLGSTIEEIKESVNNCNYIEKSSFSALNEKLMKDKLFDLNKKQIIIFGIETHICVLQTVFDLLNNSYEVFVVKDACGSKSQENKIMALDRLKNAGAQIVSTEMVLFELLRSSKHPKFKEVQTLIK